MRAAFDLEKDNRVTGHKAPVLMMVWISFVRSEMRRDDGGAKIDHTVEEGKIFIRE